LGRMRLQEDMGGAPGVTGVGYSRSVDYNAKNQVISDTVSTVKARYGSSLYDTFKSVTTYGYGAGSAYALGSVVSQSAVNTKLASGSSNWSNDPGTLTQTSYAWRDGAVQSAVFYDSDTGDSNTIASVTASGYFGSSTKVFKTSYLLNGIGQLTAAQVRDGLPKDLTYTLDAGWARRILPPDRCAVASSGARRCAPPETTPPLTLTQTPANGPPSQGREE
jgi:hypothetical protein